MPLRPPLTVVVITKNEEANIRRCLESVAWAEEVLVVDCGSTDQTQSIARSCGARVLEHPWRGYGQQKNWANSQAQHDWILSVDADETVTPQLAAEIKEFISKNANGPQFGASLPRKTFYLGRWILHGGWYPNTLIRLANRKHARWTEPAVHEEWRVDGAVGALRCDLLHYTFRGVGDQVMTNVRFAHLGAKVAFERGERGSIFKIIFKPIGKFLETYVWKMGFLDGLPGFVISVNAAHSIFMKYVELRFEKNFSHRQ
jgi:glycosyltransferase involved in cell wall biosynthesis